MREAVRIRTAGLALLAMAAAVLGLGACGSGASSGERVSASGGSSTTTYARVESRAASEHPVTELEPEGGAGLGAAPTIDVGDGSGAVRGHVDQAEQEAQRRDLACRAVTEGYVSETTDQSHNQQILGALAALEPLEVRDDDGKVVGYLIGGFTELDDYPAKKAEAEAFLRSLGPRTPPDAGTAARTTGLCTDG